MFLFYARGIIVTRHLGNNAVTAAKIDFSTFKQIIAAGIVTQPNIANGVGANATVTIPTQPNTSYYVVLTNANSGTYWSYVFASVPTKTTTSFIVNWWNNGTGAASGGVWNYIVAR